MTRAERIERIMVALLVDHRDGGSFGSFKDYELEGAHRKAVQIVEHVDENEPTPAIGTAQGGSNA